MMTTEKELIVGIHSIYEAIKNPNRFNKEIFATKEGIDEFRKKCPLKSDELAKVTINLIESHALQEKAKRIYESLELEYQRVPSQIMLMTDFLNEFDSSWVYEQIQSRIPLKILALDQVTDVHNGAAILRTAAFYGVDCVIISHRGTFGTGPSFSRIASGATEHIKIIKCSSLVKTLQKLIDLKVTVIGMSEHASENLEFQSSNSVCLVLGAEDVGLSHAVSRIMPQTISLKPIGMIKSLNVSVAAAVAMEKIFGK